MCNFNELDEAGKLAAHEQLIACADSFGGKNFFLQLVETLHKAKPNPLIARNSKFQFPLGTVTWNKVIFNDKILLLTKVRVNEHKNGNLLPKKDHKSYKKVLNLVRAFHPIEFSVTPKDRDDGDGFTFSPFDTIDKETTRINPIFDALFFCSIDTVKKALNYKPKS
ncbi:MAG: hypothetical protein U9P71_07285 [Campylobacterota bacterium]|nr:hypothetical protein [Campylobacterota bacterium]